MSYNKSGRIESGLALRRIFIPGLLFVILHLGLISAEGQSTWAGLGQRQECGCSHCRGEWNRKVVDNDSYQIGPGDLLDVRVYGRAELTREVRVTNQGTIRLPFLDEIRVACQTEAQLARADRREVPPSTFVIRRLMSSCESTRVSRSR
jgi:hypothetical protein